MERIVHVIDNLARGGAETLFVNLLPDLSKHYAVVLVTLDDNNEFDEDISPYCYRHYCLGHTGHLALPASVSKLKQIINKYNPVLVRSDLFWSTIIAKLACPKRIPLLFAVHITMDVFKETILGPALALLEKITLRRRFILIGVSREVTEGYKRKFGFSGRSFVLYNYVGDCFFSNQKNHYNQGDTLRLLAVGNLRPQKNYQYLIEAFKQLKGVNISLDIYGAGGLYDDLNRQIQSNGLSICLKGKARNVCELMKEYDGFVMISSLEGFGIAVAEAMATGLPLILSDLPVLREVTANQAFFVNVSDPGSFVALVKSFLAKENDVNRHVKSNRNAAQENYSQKVYLKRLLKIYETAITNKITAELPK